MTQAAPDSATTHPLTQYDRDLLDSFRQRYPFALDPFQEEAVRHVAAGDSVIVSAPTGAGKTLIAEFAIYRALSAQRRVIYTTPLKALSNQKYADFVRQFGSDLVGILTGDVKVNPHAPVLVMTTEILRNLLFTEKPEDVATAVLDECHYLGDEGRGTVWEEIIINAPLAMQLVALSATVSNLHEIAAWIGEVHRPIRAIYHPVRPVPLQYLLCHMDGEIAALDAPPRRGRQVAPEVRVRGDRWRGRGRQRAVPDRGRRRPASPGQVIPQLETRRWLPAIYFIFSRSGCERALRRFLEDGGSLLDPTRRPEVDEAIANTLRDYPSIMPETEVNALLLEGLRRGAGVHHAGILPALKRLTEVLFERGLVRVVFATETMSLGIHMPAKSVVIQGVRKRTDVGFRRLMLNELTQMAGRAGRRGIDPEGKCLIGLDAPEAEDEVRELLAGRPEPIESRFRIGYSSAALLVGLYREPAAVRRVIESSFGQYQNRRRIRTLEAERADLLARLAKAEGLHSPCCSLTDLVAYREKRAALEAERERVRRLGLGGRRGGRRGRGRAEEGSPWSESLHEARQRIEAMALELSGVPCHRCPHRGEQERVLKRSDRIRQATEGRGRQVRDLEQSYWEQFLRVVEVLRHFDYLVDTTLSSAGRLIGSLRHDNELLVARVAFSGLMEGLAPAETAALLSCLVEEPREVETRFARELLRRHSHLRRRVQAMEALTEEVRRVQESRRVTLPISMHLTYLAAAYEWTAGEEDWARLTRTLFASHEGDLIRAFRRLIDLCRQLVDSPELSDGLRASLQQAVRMLDRGIVLESALI